jgi:hypothetical protein
VTNLNVEVLDFEKVLSSLAGLGPEVIAAADAAIEREAEYELSITKEFVPVATGNLKASGRVERSEMLTVDIVYGGPAGSGGPEQELDVDYAVPVHENLEAHHPNGMAKFVEIPVNAERGTGRALRRLMADINGQMGWSGESATQPRDSSGRWIRRP